MLWSSLCTPHVRESEKNLKRYAICRLFCKKQTCNNENEKCDYKRRGREGEKEREVERGREREREPTGIRTNEVMVGLVVSRGQYQRYPLTRALMPLFNLSYA